MLFATDVESEILLVSICLIFAWRIVMYGIKFGTSIVTNITRNDICFRLLNPNAIANQIRIRHMAFYVLKIWRSNIVQNDSFS